ncbi:MAG TPA: hypothetical protein VHF67_13005 [Gaiellaceae bacterium]|nr:hypothetical protein [Gaiellaceae bacterium]
MGNAAKLGVAAAAIVAAVVLFLALRGGDDDAAPPSPAAQQAEATTGETATGAGTETDGGATTETAPPPAAPQVVRARITIGPDGPPQIRRIDARRGQRVVLTIVSQVTDHAHLHGYDLFVDVGGGRPARMTFVADTPGRFEMELEDRGQPIADLHIS